MSISYEIYEEKKKVKKSIFDFLENENKYLFNLITEIENIIYIDAHGAILKGRIYAETLCKIIAEESDLEELNSLNQIDRIKVLARDEIINDEIEKNLHNIRMIGNKAAHGEIEEDLESAISVHRSLYKITCWYMVNYIAFNFRAHKYETPKPIMEEKLNENTKLESLIGEFKELLIHNNSTATVE